MLIVNTEGEYQYVSGTKTLQASDHPAYRARIELALGVGEWLCAPDRGHTLARFRTAKQSDAKVEEFQKELGLYLERYDPEVTDILLARGAVSLNLQIDKAALDGIL